MMSADRKLVVTAAWTMTILGVWSIVQRAAQAEEVEQKPRQVRVELKVTGPSIPMLAKIPVLGHLFENAAAKETVCRDKKVAADDDTFERIGIDWEPASREICAHDQAKLCCENCEVELCPACPAQAQVAVAAKAACANACCAKADCAKVAASCAKGDVVCCPALHGECGKLLECIVRAAGAEEVCEVEHCQKTECVVASRVGELVAENTALAAALEAREELFEVQKSMWERYAMLLAEKVKLEAQLECNEALLAERMRSMEKIQELALDNSRLKNMVEMTAMRHDVERSKQELAQENQRLKARVSELEIASRDKKSEVRVTKNPYAPVETKETPAAELNNINR